MNPWQQQPGPHWGPPPSGPPQQPQPPYPQTYSQQPYAPQGYPQQYQGFPHPPPRPVTSGTAVTAIVLSLFIALFQGFACLGYLALASELSDSGDAIRDWVPGFLYFEGIMRLLIGAALVVGAVLMMRRRVAGRWIVAAAAITVVLSQMVEYAVRSTVLPTSGASPLSTLISVILPIALIVVALNKGTRRWLYDGRLRR